MPWQKKSTNIRGPRGLRGTKFESGVGSPPAHPSSGVWLDGDLWLDVETGTLHRFGGPASDEDNLYAARGAARHVGPAWMVIGTQSVPQMQTAAQNGATHILVQAVWDQTQTTLGGPVDASAVKNQIIAAAALGLNVCFEAALQYPPQFVVDNVPAFKDQDGTEWTAEAASGDNVRDWIYSRTGRVMVADFLDKLLAQLPWALIERVRIGGLQRGELQYPGDGTVRWFGFSAPAQTGVDIAPGVAPCPVPGHVPADTGWEDDDESFVTWYLQGMTNWMSWLIARYRTHFDGPIFVLHPGAGMRPNSQFPTSPDQGENYRVNASRGLDWDAALAAYPDRNIWPYCTWADSRHFWEPAPFSEQNDGNAAPWYHLLRVARKYGRSGHLWGENTGGQTNADMDRVFREGAVAYGYEGFVWLGHDTLTSSGDDTYANWSANIGRFS